MSDFEVDDVVRSKGGEGATYRITQVMDPGEDPSGKRGWDPSKGKVYVLTQLYEEGGNWKRGTSTDWRQLTNYVKAGRIQEFMPKARPGDPRTIDVREQAQLKDAVEQAVVIWGEDEIPVAWTHHFYGPLELEVMSKSELTEALKQGGKILGDEVTGMFASPQILRDQAGLEDAIKHIESAAPSYGPELRQRFQKFRSARKQFTSHVRGWFGDRPGHSLAGHGKRVPWRKRR